MRFFSKSFGVMLAKDIIGSLPGDPCEYCC